MLPIIDSQEISLPDATLSYYPDAFDTQTSDQLFDQLQQSINWTSRDIKMYGRCIPMPRLLAWYADKGIEYAYSGGTSAHNDWTATLRTIKQQIEKLSGSTFNGALLNLYRNGTDSMAWHSDDEKTLGHNPVIASLSLGANRLFKLRHKFNTSQTPFNITLTHGSLLIMRGTTQHYWQHQLPKTQRQIGARINITFRYIHSNP